MLTDPSGDLLITVNGETLLLDACGAAYAGAHDTLVFSDLHFEKGSAYARGRQFLPPYDTADTLARMRRAIDRHKPARVIALGDSFHDAGAADRLGPQARGLLEVMGHLHPCASVAKWGRRVRRRCFVSDGLRLILPSFGAYTGGLDVGNAAIASLFAGPFHAYMLGTSRVFAIPRPIAV